MYISDGIADYVANKQNAGMNTEVAMALQLKTMLNYLIWRPKVQKKLSASKDVIKLMKSKIRSQFTILSY